MAGKHSVGDGVFNIRFGESRKVVGVAIGESAERLKQGVIAYADQVQDVDVIAGMLLRDRDYED